MKVLNGVNNDFSNNVEDFFYEIYTKIKFVDEFKFGNKLKDQICFIDLPGFGTNNNFETKDIYSELMKSCHLFLFVFRNLIIKETSSIVMISKLFKTFIEYYSRTTTKSFINKCLFIINFEDNQKISEEYINEAKEDISTIYRNLNKNDINVSFFNAKYNDTYLEALNIYEQPEKLIQKKIKIYNNLKEDFFKGINMDFNKKTFIEQFKKELTDTIENISKEEDKKLKVVIKRIFDEKKEKNNQEDIGFITKYILKAKEKAKNSTLLPQSNYKAYSEDLYNFILSGNKRREKQIINDLKEPFNNLDIIFNVPFVSKKGELEKEPSSIIQKPHIGEELKQFRNEIEKYLKSIHNEFKNDKNTYHITQLLKDSLDDLKNTLKEGKKFIDNPKLRKKNEGDKALFWVDSNNWKDIQAQFEKCFLQKTENLKNNFIKSIKVYSNNIIEYYKKCLYLLKKMLDYLYLQRLFPLEDEIVNLEDYFSSKITEYSSKEDISKIIQDIIDDINEGSKECTNFDKRKSFFDWIYSKISDSKYLHQIIDYMIDNSTKQFNKFIEIIDKIITSYHDLIFNSIQVKKKKIIDELEDLKEREKIYIKEKTLKNEKEKKEWEEKKRLYEKEKEEWENICKEYKQIKNEMDKFTKINIFK